MDKKNTVHLQNTILAFTLGLCVLGVHFYRLFYRVGFYDEYPGLKFGTLLLAVGCFGIGIMEAIKQFKNTKSD